MTSVNFGCNVMRRFTFAKSAWMFVRILLPAQYPTGILDTRINDFFHVVAATKGTMLQVSDPVDDVVDSLWSTAFYIFDILVKKMCARLHIPVSNILTGFLLRKQLHIQTCLTLFSKAHFNNWHTGPRIPNFTWKIEKFNFRSFFNFPKYGKTPQINTKVLLLKKDFSAAYNRVNQQ